MIGSSIGNSSSGSGEPRALRWLHCRCVDVRRRDQGFGGWGRWLVQMDAEQMAEMDLDIDPTIFDSVLSFHPPVRPSSTFHWKFIGNSTSSHSTLVSSTPSREYLQSSPLELACEACEAWGYDLELTISTLRLPGPLQARHLERRRRDQANDATHYPWRLAAVPSFPLSLRVRPTQHP